MNASWLQSALGVRRAVFVKKDNRFYKDLVIRLSISGPSLVLRCRVTGVREVSGRARTLHFRVVVDHT